MLKKSASFVLTSKASST